MGQHKNNPNSILKKEGKIDPKPRNLTAREKRNLMYEALMKTDFGKIIDTVNKATDGVYK